MEFLTWLNENKPEHYKSMQVLHGEILMEGLNVLVNEFVNSVKGEEMPETSELLSIPPCDVCEYQNTQTCLECNDYNMFQQILPF